MIRKAPITIQLREKRKTKKKRKRTSSKNKRLTELLTEVIRRKLLCGMAGLKNPIGDPRLSDTNFHDVAAHGVPL